MNTRTSDVDLYTTKLNEIIDQSSHQSRVDFVLAIVVGFA